MHEECCVCFFRFMLLEFHVHAYRHTHIINNVFSIFLAVSFADAVLIHIMYGILVWLVLFFWFPCLVWFKPRKVFFFLLSNWIFGEINRKTWDEVEGLEWCGYRYRFDLDLVMEYDYVVSFNLQPCFIQLASNYAKLFFFT